MTKDEIRSNIEAWKSLLEDTDYQAIKFAEGAISEEEYEPIRLKREKWRYNISVYEKALMK